MVFGLPRLLGELGHVAVGGELRGLIRALRALLRLARGLLHNNYSFRN